MAMLGLVAGLVALILGGGLLVRGASQVSAGLGVSQMVIGLTVVAFGTSSPELFVNVAGALRAETQLAFGNVVGSNIANLALVLGVAAVIYPINIESRLVKREVPLFLLAAAVMTVFALDGLIEGGPNVIGRSDALVLLLIFCVFLYVTANDVMDARRDTLVQEISDSPLVPEAPSSMFGLLLVPAGLVLLYVGGELTVRSAIVLADSLNVPKAIVGLLVVAIGTSLPELVTSAIAAARRESDLAIGNVIGSNIFNALFVLPVTALVRPLPVPRGGTMDVGVSFALAAALLPIFVIGKAQLRRPVAAVFLVIYFGYATYRVLGSVAGT
jgi:cation:H+ antiporter